MIKLVLIQGDSLRVLPKLPDESADLVLTDPPYNIKKARWDDVDLSFYRGWLKEAERVTKHTVVMFCSHIFVKDLRIIAEDELGLKYKMMLIWDWREAVRQPLKNYTVGYDTILVWAKNESYIFNKPPRFSQCWNILKFTRVQSDRREGGMIKNGRRLKWHIAQKPIDLIEHLIKVHSNEGDVVLDPFLGSGTTMKACLELKRNCIGIEIEPEYIEIAKRRLNWSQSSGDIEFKFLDLSKEENSGWDELRRLF